MKTLEVSKSFGKVIKWLLKAVGHDTSRKGLECIYYRDGVLVAIDGFRLHAYRVESEESRQCLDTEGKKDNLFRTRLLGSIGKKMAWLVDEDDSTFPHYEQIFPGTERETACVMVNARYLAQALADIPLSGGIYNTVCLRLYIEPDRKYVNLISIENEDNTAVALVMPQVKGTGAIDKSDFSAFMPKVAP